MERNDRPKMNMYLDLFLTFFKLGLFTIGGGMVMIPLLQDIVVNKKKWLSEEEMIDCIAVSQGLPGVIAINMATYIGNRKKGLLGSIIATTGVMLPSLIIIMIIVEVLRGIGGNRFVKGALYGIRAAATGLIAYSAYKVGRTVLKDLFAVIVSAVSFCLVAFLGINAVWAIIGGIAAGLIYDHFRKGKSGGSGEEKSGGGV